MTCLGNLLAREAEQLGAGSDLGVLRHLVLKALALHIHGIDAHMDQDLDAVIGNDADSVRHDDGDRTVDGGDNG